MHIILNLEIKLRRKADILTKSNHLFMKSVNVCIMAYVAVRKIASINIIKLHKYSCCMYCVVLWLLYKLLVFSQ